MIPKEIEQMISQSATIAVSVSGGKDSQCQMYRLVELGVKPTFLIHADLGRVEWPQSMAMCEKLSEEAKSPLVVVKRERGDLLQQIEERMVKLKGTDKPYWPSSATRYCTSDQKRDPIDKEFRKHKLIISVEGIRAAESRSRAKKSPLSIRKRITTKRLRNMTIEQALKERKPNERLAVTWYPIFNLSDEQVYQACGHSIDELKERRKLYQYGNETEALDGWNMHPAYVYGNDRVSCMICVLASTNDICNGARHNPELHQEYIALEVKGGKTFKKNLSLAELEL